MLKGGCVENWVVIIDFKDAGIFSIPVDMMKSIITSFQSKYKDLFTPQRNDLDYKGQLAWMFIFNVSVVIRALWVIAKNFLDPVTQLKMPLTNN
jgi:hypothetical protein